MLDYIDNACPKQVSRISNACKIFDGIS